MPTSFWIILGLILIAIVAGALLWRPLWTNPKERGSLGSALLTGGLISLAFWGLQDVNAEHQQKIAHRAEQHERELARQQEAQQRQIARRQTLLITVGLQKDFVDADLAGQELDGVNLSGKDLEGADLHGANLEHARLIDTNLHGANLEDVSLLHADLQGADLREATLDGVNLRHTYMFGVDLVHATFATGTNGRPANLSDATLINANAHGACFAHADLRGAKISGADFTETVLTGADLREAQTEYDGIPLNLQRAFTAGVRPPGSVAARKLIAAGTWRVRGHPARVPVPASAHEDSLVSIFSGDTIELEHRGWVRLLGIGGPSAETRVGREGTSYVRKLFSAGNRVRYVLGPEPREPQPPDVGRWLAYVWLPNGLFLNQALVERGYAHRETKHRENRRYARVLAHVERDAKATAVGLWRSCAQ